MKYYMDRTLKFWVDVEYERIKHNYPYLKPSEIVAGILCEFESVGHASRYARKDGKLGWRSTDKMREDLFEQEQEALDD